jgi:hypothetical protein
MSFITSTTFPTTCRRIRGQYIALATGVALAIAAAIGYAGWQEAGSGGKNAPTPVSQQHATSNTTRGTDSIYIVASEAQRDRLLTGAAN